MAPVPPSTAERVTIGPGDVERRFTDDEYSEAIFEEPWRHELVGGRLVVLPPNSEDHDNAAELWRDQLVGYKLSHRDRIQKMVSEAWVKIGQGHYRIGDIGVYLVGDRSKQRRPARAPELMIEVLSRGRDSFYRDAVEKRADYHSIEVLEYVIVDYVNQTVTVLTHAPGDYEERVLRVGDIYTTPLLPGLAIPLAEAFAASSD